MTPFTLFIRNNLDRLRPLLLQTVPIPIAHPLHPVIAIVVGAASDILRALPGIEIVDLHHPAVGFQANSIRVLPAYRRQLQEQELEAAAAVVFDTLVAPPHSYLLPLRAPLRI